MPSTGKPEPLVTGVLHRPQDQRQNCHRWNVPGLRRLPASCRRRFAEWVFNERHRGGQCRLERIHHRGPTPRLRGPFKSAPVLAHRGHCYDQRTCCRQHPFEVPPLAKVRLRLWALQARGRIKASNRRLSRRTIFLVRPGSGSKAVKTVRNRTALRLAWPRATVLPEPFCDFAAGDTSRHRFPTMRSVNHLPPPAAPPRSPPAAQQARSSTAPTAPARAASLPGTCAGHRCRSQPGRRGSIRAQ